MEDQMNYLASICIPAVAIGDENDPELIQQVKNGIYLVVYCSPELLLSTEAWREIFDDDDSDKNWSALLWMKPIALLNGTQLIIDYLCSQGSVYSAMDEKPTIKCIRVVRLRLRDLLSRLILLLGHAVYTEPKFQHIKQPINQSTIFIYLVAIFQGAFKVKQLPISNVVCCLGELRSLIPKECNIMVLTATASQQTINEIFDSLQLSRDNITIIQQSPNKENILYTKQYLDKNDPIEKQFGSIIDEVKTRGIDTPRTIIYCQTRKQCSVLFRMFEVYLFERLYNGSATNCKHRIVDMFHAGTPNTVKQHIAEQTVSETGVTRILIATIAYGMGVNCKQVRRIVHFGPSKSIEVLCTRVWYTSVLVHSSSSFCILAVVVVWKIVSVAHLLARSFGLHNQGMIPTFQNYIRASKAKSQEL